MLLHAATKTKRTTDPVAIQINDLHRRIMTGEHAAVADKVALGRMLLAKKKELGHGELTPWIARHCEFSDRTARNYMAAARVVDGDGGKRKPLAVLPNSVVKLYTLGKKINREDRRQDADSTHLGNQLFPIADDIQVHHVPGGIEDMDQHVRPHTARLMVIDPPYHRRHL